MISSTSFYLYPEGDTLKEISLLVERWQSTQRCVLTIDKEETVYNGFGDEAQRRFVSELSRLGAKEPWQWEHGVD